MSSPQIDEMEPKLGTRLSNHMALNLETSLFNTSSSWPKTSDLLDDLGCLNYLDISWIRFPNSICLVNLISWIIYHYTSSPPRYKQWLMVQLSCSPLGKGPWHSTSISIDVNISIRMRLYTHLKLSTVVMTSSKCKSTLI